MTENIINQLNKEIEGYMLAVTSIFRNNRISELEEENKRLRKNLREARGLAQSWRDTSWASIVSDNTIPTMNGKPILPWEEG